MEENQENGREVRLGPRGPEAMEPLNPPTTSDATLPWDFLFHESLNPLLFSYLLSRLSVTCNQKHSEWYTPA